MAIIDDNLFLCNAVALNTSAAVAGTDGTGYLIGSQINTRTVRDLGNGRPVYLVIDVHTGIEAAGAGTVAFQLASDSSESVAVIGSTKHFRTPAIVTSTTTDTTTLVAGTRLFECAIPSDGINPYEDFLGIIQIPVANAITAGAVNIYLTLDPTSQRYYPNGI